MALKRATKARCTLRPAPAASAAGQRGAAPRCWPGGLAARGPARRAGRLVSRARGLPRVRRGGTPVGECWGLRPGHAQGSAKRGYRNPPLRACLRAQSAALNSVLAALDHLPTTPSGHPLCTLLRCLGFARGKSLAQPRSFESSRWANWAFPESVDERRKKGRDQGLEKNVCRVLLSNA